MSKNKHKNTSKAYAVYKKQGVQAFSINNITWLNYTTLWSRMLTTEGDDMFWEGESIAAVVCDPKSSCSINKETQLQIYRQMTQMHIQLWFSVMLCCAVW